MIQLPLIDVYAAAVIVPLPISKIGVPVGAARSTPLCCECWPVTGCVRSPKGLVSRNEEIGETNVGTLYRFGDHDVNGDAVRGGSGQLDTGEVDGETAWND